MALRSDSRSSNSYVFTTGIPLMTLFNPNQSLNLNFGSFLNAANANAAQATSIFNRLSDNLKASQDKTKEEYKQANTNALISKLHGVDRSLTLGEQQQRRQDILNSIGSNKNLDFTAINQADNLASTQADTRFNNQRTREFQDSSLAETVRNNQRAEQARQDTYNLNVQRLDLQRKQFKYTKNNNPTAMLNSVIVARNNSMITTKDKDGNEVKQLDRDKFQKLTKNLNPSIVNVVLDQYQKTTQVPEHRAAEALKAKNQHENLVRQQTQAAKVVENLQKGLPTQTYITPEALTNLIDKYGNALDTFYTSDTDRKDIQTALQQQLNSGVQLKDLQNNIESFSGILGKDLEDLKGIGNSYAGTYQSKENKIAVAKDNLRKLTAILNTGK